MERDWLLVGVALEDAGDLFAFGRGDGRIHQAERRATHQPDAGAHDLERHQQRDQRIEPADPAERHQRHADDDAQRCPDIGEQVLRIGGQRDRAQLHARAAQQQASVLHERRHQATILLGRAAAAALAVHVDRHAQVTELGQTLRLRAGEVVLPAPRMEHEHHGSPAADRDVMRHVGLAGRVAVRVVEELGLHARIVTAATGPESVRQALAGKRA